MRIAYSFEEIPKISQPVVLTIGSFDGMHIGHQALLQHLFKTAQTQHAVSAIITFLNHPSTILKPDHPTPLLCTVEHKKMLLEKTPVDVVLFLPFTKEFSQQSADVFLRTVMQFLPFQTLVLGSDAHIGRNREGDRTTVTALEKTLGYNVEYFADIQKHGQRISSTLIREHLQQGRLEQTSELLGRPYSICGAVLKGNKKGTSIGFPTANLDVKGLCLPPLGVYAVSVFDGEKKLRGIANLGFAPTIRQGENPVLEVHLFDHQDNLYGKMIDVHFHSFIREEKKFGSIEELRNQIAQDLIAAKKILSSFF